MVYFYKDGEIIKTYSRWEEYLKSFDKYLTQPGVFLYETGDANIYTYVPTANGIGTRLTPINREDVPAEFKTMLLLLEG